MVFNLIRKGFNMTANTEKSNENSFVVGIVVIYTAFYFLVKWVLTDDYEQ